MALSKEEFIQLRRKGLSTNQIVKFESGQSSLEREPEEDTPNYFQRVGKQYFEVAQDIQSSVGKALTPPKKGATPLEIGKEALEIPRAGLRTVGGITKAAFAPIAEAPGIKQLLEGIGFGIQKLSETEAIQSMAKDTQPLFDIVYKYAEEHPEQAKDVKNLVDIAVLKGGKSIEKPISKTVGKATEKVGVGLIKSGEKIAQTEKQSFVRDLIKPVQTKAVKESQVARTTETGKGIFKKSIIAPTKAELASEKVVSTIKGVEKSKTVQQNFNTIKKSNIEEALRLENSIKANEFQVPKGETLLRIERAGNNLLESPLITGDAEKTAQKLITGAKKFIEKNPETGSGVLKARKQYDIWVRSQKPSVFDAKADSAFTLANREIRSAMNNLLEERASSLGIKESLKKQSSLFNALENLTPKAAIEADSAIGRTMQNIGKVLGTKSRVVQAVAAAAGIGGLGAAATFAPAVAIAGIPTFLLWKGGQFILKPQVRIAIGNLLKEAGTKISTSDRNALIGVLNNYAENR